MFLRRATIKNFRLLRDVTLTFDRSATVIVGRNNTGKTSLTELFRRLLDAQELPRFWFEDFSIGTHEAFWNSYVLERSGQPADQVRAALPVIEIMLHIDYGATPGNAPLPAGFVIDLDESCTEAVLRIQYRLKDGGLAALFKDITLTHEQSPQAAPVTAAASAPAVEAPQRPIASDAPDSTTPQMGREPVGNAAVGERAAEQRMRRAGFYRRIQERIPELYEASATIIDPTNPDNQAPTTWKQVRSMFGCGFISAQRELDDVSRRSTGVLSKVLQSLFNSAVNGEDAATADTLAKLEASVASMQETLDTRFNESVTALIPLFSLFGYPSLNDIALGTETILDVHRLLTDNTVVQYSTSHGSRLPESHDGLGSRNLIYILLRIYDLLQEFRAKTLPPGIQLIFIEEPEAHLHPQMQTVFMSKLKDLPGVLAERFNEGRAWPVQFVVTTHSSHLANQAAFSAIRYFGTAHMAGDDRARKTVVKDLDTGLAGTPADQIDFVHKYLTQTRCDLFFADKAILVEGDAERILMPRLVQLAEATWHDDGVKLSSQYISTITVGGAHAHKFLPLLNLLALPTLIITDLDPAKRDTETNRDKKCRLSVADRTTNACIRHWFGDPAIAPATLIQKPVAEKIRSAVRIAYQVPEDGSPACGCTLEPAFALANRTHFDLGAVADDAIEDALEEQFKNADKTGLAIQHLTGTQTWAVPRYIAEGLRWLADTPTNLEVTV